MKLLAFTYTWALNAYLNINEALIWMQKHEVVQLIEILCSCLVLHLYSIHQNSN